MKVKIIIKPLTLIGLQFIQFLGKQLKPILSSMIIAEFRLFQVERKLPFYLFLIARNASLTYSKEDRKVTVMMIHDRA